MAMEGEAFDARAYLPRELYEAVTEVRVRQPGLAEAEAARRMKRPLLAPDGKLVILAADQDNSPAMGSRHELLARVLRALSHRGVDGVMAPPDLIEDLYALAALIRERGGQSPLDDRVVIGCMNRGGRPGTVWEVDGRFTAFTARRLAVMGMDGGQLMVRIDPADARSAATIEGCARVVSELAELQLLSFLEPLPVVREGTAYRVQRTVTALTGAVSVAAAMGASSLYTWLQLPTCPSFEAVAAATTLPIVILGGEAVGAPPSVLADLSAALQVGSNVRGAIIGRNVLYPGDDDPRAIAAATAAIIHEDSDLEAALAIMEAERGKDPQLV
ncbi:MAG TPA: hypothetical protein VLD61_05925 [Methylomirabilota bacterium]|nr:hypothetical protein [Methylomirabilota bacterium]